MVSTRTNGGARAIVHCERFVRTAPMSVREGADEQQDDEPEIQERVVRRRVCGEQQKAEDLTEYQPGSELEIAPHTPLLEREADFPAVSHHSDLDLTDLVVRKKDDRLFPSALKEGQAVVRVGESADVVPGSVDGRDDERGSASSVLGAEFADLSRASSDH